MSPPTRLAIVAAILMAEALAFSTWLDNASLYGLARLPGFIARTGPWVLRVVIGFAGFFLTFSILQSREALRQWIANVSPGEPRWVWVAIHAGSLAAFVWLSSTLYGRHEGANLQGIAALWLLAIRTTGNLWLYAAAAAILASLLTGLSQQLWQAAAELTFRLVQIILRPLLPVMTVEPGNFRIRGSRFSVVVNQECSGLEGASLILVFGAVWLWLFRRELRFPRSFLLLPAGVVIL